MHNKHQEKERSVRERERMMNNDKLLFFFFCLPMKKRISATGMP